MTQLLSERLTYTDSDMYGGRYWIYLWSVTVGDKLFRWIDAIRIIYMADTTTHLFMLVYNSALLLN